MSDKYDITIGLEIHAELNSKTKVFCSCANKFGAEPNTLVCPVCLGLPGTVPSINKQCVMLAMKAGLMTNCKIHEDTSWERKNYFYPDLTKGYQISQIPAPISYDGWVELDSGKKIGISDIHLEEDTGKLVHMDGKTYIDYNRCGIPLIETVTKPDISSADEAVEFLEKLRSTYIYGDIALCKMEQGGMRCDVNLSVKPKGSKVFGNKVEMKNLGSFRAVKQAIEYEANRQMTLLDEGKVVVEETRKWDEKEGVNVAMRAKLASGVYRGFLDPDIPVLHIPHEVVEKCRSELPLTPEQLKVIYKEKYNLPDYDISIITAKKELVKFFEDCIKLYPNAKDLSNWIMGELLRNVKNDISITPENFVKIIKLVEDKKISRVNAVPLIAAVMEANEDPETLAKKMDMMNLTLSENEIESIICAILEKNPKAVEDYKVIPDKITTFITGQVMKETKGKADFVLVKKVIVDHFSK